MSPFVSSIVFLLFLSPLLLSGATFSVTNNQDAGAGSLRKAITDANNNGDSNNTIKITSGLSPIVLASPLPIIDKSIKIQTLSGSQTIDGNRLYRGLVIGNGDMEVQGLTFVNTKAKGGDGGLSGGGGGGGMGGALLVTSGSVLIDTASFSNCTSEGGKGGTFTPLVGGGGGGGFFGNGGTASGTGGAGGGGITSDGNLSTNLNGSDGGASCGGGGGGGINGTGGAAGDISCGQPGGNGTSMAAGNGGNGGNSLTLGLGAGGGGGGAGGNLQGGSGNHGGFGAGGGGAGYTTENADGGNGGFSGGGGLSSGSGTQGMPGFGGGSPIANNSGGGGGAFGGAIFIADGAELTLKNPQFENNQVIAPSGASALGTDIFLMSGGSLTFDTTQDLQIHSAIESDQQLAGSPGGGIIKKGAAELSFLGLNTYTGTTVVDEGTLKGSTRSLQGDIENNATVIFDQTANGIYSGTLSGTGAVIKEGRSSVTFSGINSYKGGTVIRGGTLTASKDLGIGDPSGSLTITGGACFLASNSFTTDRHIILSGIGTVDTISGVTLTCKGPITGNGKFYKLEEGTLIFGGVNTYTGGTIILKGTLQGTTTSLQGDIDNRAFLVFDQGINGIYSGSLSGRGKCTKKGSGKVIFSGDNSEFIGPTLIQEGELQINGPFGSDDIVVEVSGALTGVTTLHNIQNNGTLSTGNSIGTLTVANYNQGPNGTLLVEINDMNATDVLVVTGTANLDGTVLIEPEPGIYTPGQTYTFLQAGTINGQFAQLLETSPLNFQITYFPQSIQLAILSQGAVLPTSLNHLTGNAESIGNYLFSCSSSYSSSLFSVLNPLVHLSPSDFENALLQLGPQSFGALPLTRLETGTWIAQSMNQINEVYKTYLTETQSCVFSSPWWLETFGYYYKQNEWDEQVPFNDRTYGLTIGWRKIFSNRFLLSIGGGYSNSNLNWFENRGGADAQSVYLSPSFGYVGDRGYIGLVLQGSRTLYSVDRKIRFSTVKETAHNDHKSWETLGGLHGGFKIKVPETYLKNFFIVPAARIDYLNIFENGYQESGAGSVNLSVRNQTSSFIRSEVTLRFVKELVNRSFQAFPNLYAGWLNTIWLSNASYTSRFYKQPLCEKYFSVNSYYKATNQLLLGGELSTKCMDSISLKIGYEAHLGYHRHVQEGTFKLDWEF